MVEHREARLRYLPKAGIPSESAARDISVDVQESVTNDDQPRIVEADPSEHDKDSARGSATSRPGPTNEDRRLGGSKSKFNVGLQEAVTKIDGLLSNG